MRFAKMQGTGNDYIYVNCLEEVVNEPDILARRLSDRHFGVGADGLVLIRPSGRADFAMEMYNADGSRGEMCGNGIRCLGKYVYDRGLTDKRELDIQTGSGTRHLRLFPGEGDGAGGEIRMVEVNMGKPVLEADQVPAISEHTCMVHEPVRVGGVEYPMTAVSMGNPHAVIFTGHVRGIDLQRLGPSIEYHGRFPRRVNVEFAQVEDRRTARVRVWERGSGDFPLNFGHRLRKSIPSLFCRPRGKAYQGFRPDLEEVKWRHLFLKNQWCISIIRSSIPYPAVF